MDLRLVIYDRSKYEKNAKELKSIEYNGVKSFRVKTIPVNKILAETDESNLDPYNEYLIIKFAYGATSTFRNSYVNVSVLH